MAPRRERLVATENPKMAQMVQAMIDIAVVVATQTVANNQCDLEKQAREARAA